MRAADQTDQPLTGGAVTPRAVDAAAPPSAPLRPVFSAEDLGQYADDLRRYARRRVRDEALAEDAVQDALVAALVSLPSFQGHSSLKTWLHGILTHKIQDAFRRETRYVRLPASATDDPSSCGDDTMGVAAGALISEDDPVRELSRGRFRVAVTEAIERLPLSLRQVFLMQAIEGLPTETVCLRLGISESNCWVRLHRARKRLSGQLAGHY